MKLTNKILSAAFIVSLIFFGLGCGIKENRGDSLAKITSKINAEKFIGQRVEAVGVFHLELTKIYGSLEFADGTYVSIMDRECKKCKTYDGKKVKIIATLSNYPYDQLATSAYPLIENIESINLSEE